jgi:NADH dehydrogenase
VILVTGASGFVGGYLVPELLRRGRAVRAMVRDPAKGERLKAAGAEIVKGDLLDPASLERAVQGCGSVLHLAAVADSSDRELNFRVNVVGTRNLGECCAKSGTYRVVNISSTCAGRRMRDAYGESKAQAEGELRPPLRVTQLRPTMIYGHGSPEFDLFARAVRQLPRVPIPGDGRARLRPVFVGDFVELVVRVLDDERSVGRTYDVAGPETISFDEFVGTLGRAQGRKRRTLHVPASLALLGARALGRAMRHPFVNVDQVMAFLQDTDVDIDPARRELGWDPRPLDEGLAELFGGNP